MSDSGSGSVPAGATPFGSRYLLLDPLGSGSMGRVYRGQVRDTGEPVAIKVLRDDLASQPDIVARFIQERQVLRAVNHANVVGVRDLVVEGEQLGIIMDLVTGGDLRTAVRIPLPADEALAIICEVADGLAAVHAANVVHRDLKPENVLADRWPDGRPRPRLTDFGVSRLISQSMTKVTSLIGTPGYLAPESVAGRPTESPADIYALGVMLYEMTCNRPPFVADNVLALIRAHAEDAVPYPTGMPAPLWQLLQSMLAKHPEQRPTALQVAQYSRSLIEGCRGTGPFAVGTTDPNVSTHPSGADATLIRPLATPVPTDQTVIRPAVAPAPPPPSSTIVRPISGGIPRPQLPLTTTAPYSLPAPTARPSRTKRNVIIGAASTLVVAAAAVGVVLALSGDGKKSTSAPAGSASSSTAAPKGAVGRPAQTSNTAQSAITATTATPGSLTTVSNQPSDSSLIDPVVVSRSAPDLTAGMASLAVGPNGAVLVGSTKSESYFWYAESDWDWRRLDVQNPDSAKKLFVWATTISPNGRYALTGTEDAYVRLWDLRDANGGNGNWLDAWDAGDGTDSVSVRALAWSNSGSAWAAVTNRGEVFTGDGRSFNQGCGDCAGISKVAGATSATFTTDDKYLVVGGKDLKAHIVDVSSGRVTRSLYAPGSRVWVQGVAVNPRDGRYVALVTGPESEKTESPGFLAIYDLESGDNWPIQQIDAHQTSALAVDFSPDGRYVLSGGVDGAVIVWDGWKTGAWNPVVRLDFRSVDGGRDCRVGDAKFTLDGTGVAATCITPGSKGFAVVWKFRN